MNFGKAKTILIYLFVFLNLFLILQLVFLSGSDLTISDKSIEQTISFCENKGLLIEQDAIIKRIVPLNFLELLNTETNKESNDTYNLNYKISENEKEILKYLKNNGFTNYNLSFYRTILNPITKESTKRFVQNYKSYQIFGAYTDVFYKKGYIKNIKSDIYEIQSVADNSYKPLSPLDIILDLSSKTNGKKFILSQTKQAYFIPGDTKNYQNLTAVPCYIFTLNDAELFFDSCDGSFLLCITKDGAEISDISSALNSI